MSMQRGVSTDGGRLRADRFARGWTIEKLSEESGISESTIKRAEKGESIRLGTLAKITEALRIPAPLDSSICGTWHAYYIETTISGAPLLTQEELEISISDCKSYYMGRYRCLTHPRRSEFTMKAKFVRPIIIGTYIVSNRDETNPEGLGSFQLMIGSDDAWFDGYCTWYDTDVRQVCCSRNIWIKLESGYNKELQKDMEAMMDAEKRAFEIRIMRAHAREN